MKRSSLVVGGAGLAIIGLILWSFSDKILQTELLPPDLPETADAPPAAPAEEAAAPAAGSDVALPSEAAETASAAEAAESAHEPGLIRPAPQTTPPSRPGNAVQTADAAPDSPESDVSRPASIAADATPEVDAPPAADELRREVQISGIEPGGDGAATASVEVRIPAERRELWGEDAAPEALKSGLGRPAIIAVNAAPRLNAPLDPEALRGEIRISGIEPGGDRPVTVFVEARSPAEQGKLWGEDVAPEALKSGLGRPAIIAANAAPRLNAPPDPEALRGEIRISGIEPGEDRPVTATAEVKHPAEVEEPGVEDAVPDKPREAGTRVAVIPAGEIPQRAPRPDLRQIGKEAELAAGAPETVVSADAPAATALPNRLLEPAAPDAAPAEAQPRVDATPHDPKADAERLAGLDDSPPEPPKPAPTALAPAPDRGTLLEAHESRAAGKPPSLPEPGNAYALAASRSPSTVPEVPHEPEPAAPIAAAFSPVRTPKAPLRRQVREPADLPVRSLKATFHPSLSFDIEVPQHRSRPDAAPRAEGPAEVPSGLSPPVFDLVRVDPDGSTFIAGHADPGVEIDIEFEGAVHETVRTNRQGDFVAMLSAELREGPQELRLVARDIGPAEIRSEDRIVVLVAPETPELDIPLLPAVIRAAPDRIELVQPAQPGLVDRVILDTISYDDQGAVVLSGRGRPHAPLRIYADNQEIANVRVSQTGAWTAVVPDIAQGRYTLRVDELDNSGARVSSRMETPFQRDLPTEFDQPAVRPAVRAQEVRGTVYVVQPGNNLWKIARLHLGKGIRYNYIYRANQDRIRNPDLIYPGQIFEIPPRAVVEAQDRGE